MALKPRSLVESIGFNQHTTDESLTSDKTGLVKALWFLVDSLPFHFNRMLLRRKAMRKQKAWCHLMERSILQSLVTIMGIPQSPALNHLLLLKRIILQPLVTMRGIPHSAALSRLLLLLVHFSHHHTTYPLNQVPHPLITMATNHHPTNHLHPIQGHRRDIPSHLTTFPRNLVQPCLVTMAADHPLPTTSHCPLQSHHLIQNHLHLITSPRLVIDHPDPSLCCLILLWSIQARPPSPTCSWSQLLMLFLQST